MSTVRPTRTSTTAGRGEGQSELQFRSGDVLEVTREASVQFAIPIWFRVIRVHDWPTYTGWVWLDGYQLSGNGEAVERRSIFVQAGGLRRARPQWGQARSSRRLPNGSHKSGTVGTDPR